MAVFTNLVQELEMAVVLIDANVFEHRSIADAVTRRVEDIKPQVISKLRARKSGLYATLLTAGYGIDTEPYDHVINKKTDFKFSIYIILNVFGDADFRKRVDGYCRHFGISWWFHKPEGSLDTTIMGKTEEAQAHFETEELHPSLVRLVPYWCVRVHRVQEKIEQFRALTGLSRIHTSGMRTQQGLWQRLSHFRRHIPFKWMTDLTESWQETMKRRSDALAARMADPATGLRASHRFGSAVDYEFRSEVSEKFIEYLTDSVEDHMRRGDDMGTKLHAVILNSDEKIFHFDFPIQGSPYNTNLSKHCREQIIKRTLHILGRFQAKGLETLIIAFTGPAVNRAEGATSIDWIEESEEENFCIYRITVYPRPASEVKEEVCQNIDGFSMSYTSELLCSWPFDREED